MFSLMYQKLNSCNSISSKVIPYLPGYYNKKSQIDVLLKLVHRYLVLPSSVTIRITLLRILYTYFTHQNHEILNIFKIFLEAEMKS